jgi:hypothetical protein
MISFSQQKDFPYSINVPTLTNPTAKTPPSPMSNFLPTAAPFNLNGFDEPLPVTRLEVDGSVPLLSVVVVGVGVVLGLKVTICVTLVAGSVDVGMDVVLSLGESCI